MNDKDSKVVVAGNLNKIGVKNSDFLTKSFNLTPALDSTQATHKKGGHLDNIWTNLKISEQKLSKTSTK